MKTCSKCHEIKSLENFHNEKRRKDGKQSRCKSCNLNDVREKIRLNPEENRRRAKEWQRANPEKRYAKQKRYIDKNKSKACEISRNYSFAKWQRTPKWLTDEEKSSMKKFYENRPAGYHVDHIIPLRGENVSGLHVLSNLQYLLAAEHCRKGNKF